VFYSTNDSIKRSAFNALSGPKGEQTVLKARKLLPFSNKRAKWALDFGCI
jgi:hypothetical protein